MKHIIWNQTSNNTNVEESVYVNVNNDRCKSLLFDKLANAAGFEESLSPHLSPTGRQPKPHSQSP